MRGSLARAHRSLVICTMLASGVRGADAKAAETKATVLEGMEKATVRCECHRWCSHDAGESMPSSWHDVSLSLNSWALPRKEGKSPD